MSRRESTIKSVAGALQPKGYDLTQHAKARVANRVRDAMKVRGDDAAGALAFASKDRELAGPDGLSYATHGSPLAVLLLRLKIADQFSKELLVRTHEILLDRHGGLATKKSETMSAVAFVALFEWVHDICAECRGNRPGHQQPQRCPVCPPFRSDDMELGRDEGDRQGKRLANPAMKVGPSPGCPKCKGLGRVFSRPRKSRGMKCVTCRNSGRMELKRKVRWKMVSAHLADLQEERDEPRRGIDYDSFRIHWLQKYERFLEVLRATDYDMAAGVDLGLNASQNRGTPIQEEHSVEPAQSDFDDPAEAHGEVAAPNR